MIVFLKFKSKKGNQQKTSYDYYRGVFWLGTSVLRKEVTMKQKTKEDFCGLLDNYCNSAKQIQQRLNTKKPSRS